jgi:two-component system NarL family sensor kinase
VLYRGGALVSRAVARPRPAPTRPRLAAAEERNRLAREIHDTLAQSLAAISMQLETADALAESRGDTRLAGTVRRALALTRSTLDEARRSVMELRAAPLEGRTVVEALRALGDEFRGITGAPLALDVMWEGAEIDLPPAVEIGLYRIAREALANVARHAHATRATVRLWRDAGAIRMQIADSGTGFDSTNVPAGRFGLIGMSERARLLGGSLNVQSAPGEGTVIAVDVPLPADVSPMVARA